VSDLFFYLLTAIVLAGALFVAFSGNIIHSAFALLVSLSFMAGYYVLLGADLLANLQILIYVGGILVLILFALMLTREVAQNPARSNPATKGVLALLIPLFFGGFWITVNYSTPFVGIPVAETKPITADTGALLLGDYLLPFELISFLLLAVLVGAAIAMRLHDDNRNRKGGRS